MTFFGKEVAPVGRYFGVPDAPCLATVPMQQATFSVTRLSCDASRDHVRPVGIPAQDAYFVMLYLKDVLHGDILEDGSQTQTRLYGRGSICLIDLAAGASIALHSGLDSLAFVLPKPLFGELGMFPNCPPLSGPPLSGLKCMRNAPDTVIDNLGIALMPFFRGEAGVPSQSLQHIAIAICAHLLHHYADVPPRSRMA